MRYNIKVYYKNREPETIKDISESLKEIITRVLKRYKGIAYLEIEETGSIKREGYF
jgi:hypothetical protein